MGELHLEIILDRLQRDFKVDCSLGKLQVAYREAPTLCVSKSGSLTKSLVGKNHSVTVSLKFSPSQSWTTKPLVSVTTDNSLPMDMSWEEVEEAVKRGVESACVQGVE